MPETSKPQNTTPENRLKYETSPYLLQHKDNPVHWWAWRPEALAEAQRTGKPILLSVGYAACHWCHVMAHESFEDEATAALMNELFVNIKVDREERPDIDALYMGALHRLGEQGGWPLTMFLDSAGRPFWGGTYFPREARFGRPAFATVLQRLAHAFQTQPEQVAKNAEAILGALADETAPAAPAEGEDSDGARPALPNTALVREVVRQITRAVDPKRGGLNGAPKFPQWNIFWLLWRGGIAFDDAAARKAVLTTLGNICQGGIYDHLGGGFARYAVDNRWLVPHFEKMLYDNALLLELLIEAWRETGTTLFAQRIAETVAWLEREMVAEGGGFAASLDADSEGEEGKFYVWTPEEIAGVLGAEDAELFNGVYGVSAAGNFDGANILNRLDSMELHAPELEARLEAMRGKLLAARAARVRPGWDDKVLADWNGLMIASLTHAAVVFSEQSWLALAERAFNFVTANMTTEGDRLWHSFRAGQGRAPATASDYANMTWAALRLHSATGREPFLRWAERWTATLDRHHWDDAHGGYFTAADDTRDVLLRLKPASDDAVPNANAIQLGNLLALEALTGKAVYGERAEQLLHAFAPAVLDRPAGHCGLLAASLDAAGLIQVAVIGEPGSDIEQAVRLVSLPGALQALFPLDHVPQAGAWAGKSALNGKSTVYVCKGPVCGAPLDDAGAVHTALVKARRSSVTS